MSSYAESAVNGSWTGMVRYAILNGSLWAVGSAWSTAIRAIVLEIVPQDATDIVLGELLAAASTTVLAARVVSRHAGLRVCSVQTWGMSLFDRAADLLFELDHAETLPMELARCARAHRRRARRRTRDDRPPPRVRPPATTVSTLQTALETRRRWGIFASRDDFFGDSPYLGDDTSRTHMEPYVEAFCGAFATSTVPVERRDRGQPTKHQHRRQRHADARKRARRSERRARQRLEA